ncbi:PREDICTED: uncharacterized protein LOC104611184 [Nelumbo nucifera]|uniref:Uncharacterized protein LOC104611184 n=1 Tax=Nelumbo nucifera TaxID=4432 RepID=A0A1U8BHK7_NELNU|nr:PREDICTED: uncharacterized protein LOC104611184 [Nelumbo nucifera]XP_010276445.1 PREDICTED: uncharacterized protein LOC104611184 [Nelumbo nucifera]
MDLGEPRWRTNSSFSPPPSRRWDCRFQSDGLSHGALLCGSSLSSNGKGSRGRVRSDQCTHHHQSVSDGVFSYFGSPDNFQAPQWTPPVQKFNFGQCSTPSMGGSKPGTSIFPRSTERPFTGGPSAASNSFGSPSSLSESSPLGSTNKLPITSSSCNFSSRRFFISKPVYPLVFHNPVSDCEPSVSADTSSISRFIPSENRTSPSHWPENSSGLFQKTLTELQKMDGSPEPSTSSRREGFRLSIASTDDIGYDGGEGFDISEHIDLDLGSPNYSTGDQKCGLCGRLLWQKSPWSSYRIVRGGDMPIAGVLHCSHIFHADCLEQATPKTQIHDPPCPLCLKTSGVTDESSPVSEPLHMALRSIRRNRGVVISDAQGSKSSDHHSSNHSGVGLQRNQSHPVARTSSSLLKNQIKKHLTFKGKTGKDFFGTKVFRRMGHHRRARTQ